MTLAVSSEVALSLQIRIWTAEGINGRAISQLCQTGSWMWQIQFPWPSERWEPRAGRVTCLLTGSVSGGSLLEGTSQAGVQRRSGRRAGGCRYLTPVSLCHEGNARAGSGGLDWSVPSLVGPVRPGVLSCLPSFLGSPCPHHSLPVHHLDFVSLLSPSLQVCAS